MFEIRSLFWLQRRWGDYYNIDNNLFMCYFFCNLNIKNKNDDKRNQEPDWPGKQNNAGKTNRVFHRQNNQNHL